jgi:carbonic anhydrase/acetyltransferase-like protein (isoleucine patch superfamily)
MNIPPGVNRPVIADTAWIAPTAVVVADVQLADNVSV